MEDNEIIAEFMRGNKNLGQVVHYDYYWDAIVPVVEKIEKLQEKEFMAVEVAIIGNECSIGIHKDVEHYQGLICNNCDTKFKSVYKSVVEFLKWHKLNYGQ